MIRMNDETTDMAVRQSEHHAQQVIASTVQAQLCALSKYPDDVQVECEVTGGIASVEAKCHPADFRRLCGSKGRTFQASSIVVSALAARHGLRGHYKLSDPGVMRREPEQPFQPKRDWPRDRLLGLFKSVAEEIYEVPEVVELVERGESLFVLQLDKGDRCPVPDVALADSLSVVWNAIGMNNGRVIKVGVDRR